MRVDLTRIAPLYILGIVQAESSCIRNIPRHLTGKNFYINAHVLCQCRADHTVWVEFGCVNVCYGNQEFTVALDQISPSSDANAVRVCFWGSVVYHRVCVSDFFACLEDSLDFVMIHDKHCICALLTSFVVPLHHASKVFPKCSLPNICHAWIMHQLFVTGDGLPGDGMYHWIHVMFKVGGQLFYCVLH